ncbi:MAG: hypothetical protein IMW89_03805 [Ktedonobacteraceae bacterium]|nr:hypothetical protein [Ktedonobacteraceae bacterium]
MPSANAQGTPFSQMVIPASPQTFAHEMEQKPFPGMNSAINDASTEQAQQVQPESFRQGSPPLMTPSPQAMTPVGDWQPAESALPLTPHANSGSFPRPPYVSQGGQGRRGYDAMRLRFGIAMLCVLAGGLLLLFVFFMSLGLHQSSQVTNVQTGKSTPVLKTTSAPVSPVSQSPTPAASPTPVYPGQQYIDNAQMASEVRNGRPAQLATTFKPGQQIFVTFSIHSGGRAGAYCLLWYLNNKQISHYEHVIDPAASWGYSWAYIAGTGPAYVEIYWASTVACTDKILAQHVDFTVGP